MLLFSETKCNIIVLHWRICVSFDNQPFAKVIALDDMRCHLNKLKVWNMNGVIQ